MWFGVALNIILLIISTLGSTLSGSHNGDVQLEESKFKLNDSALKNFPIFSSPTFRLPNNSIPLNYDVIITTDIDKGLFDFFGVVKIHIRIVDKSNEIALKYREMTINGVNLLSADGTTIIAETLPYQQFPVYDNLIITLPTVFNSNDEILLEIKYNGTHRSDGRGFYRGSYMNAAGVTIWYAATQFQIDDARHAMPSYDELGIRAPIHASLKHGRTYTAVSNMEVESQIDDGDYVITTFRPTPSIHTYLLAFLVSDFDYVHATHTRIPQKIYGRPELIGNGYGDFVASVVGPILNGLEQHIRVDYPISKMDHVGLTKSGLAAMENIGLTTYMENLLLYNPRTLPADKENTQRQITTVVAHEYAHQWFGNIVSPTWWQYAWLNEGLATLFQFYIPDLVYPGMNYMNDFVTNVMPNAFLFDILSLDSWAMNHYTEEPEQLMHKFDAIGYRKAGCVLRMFQETLTPSTFAKGLNYYQNAMYMKAATPDDLHAGLQRAYDEDYPGNNLNVNESMHSWEDRPGYPMISVRLINNNLVFSQRRYPDSAGEIYSVPITVATKSDPNFNRKTPSVWLHHIDVSARNQLNYSNGDWIILNIQQVGYYRVDYDSSLWSAIIKQLTENHSSIHPINRAVLLDEVFFALTDFRLASVAVTDCLDILSYLSKEDESMSWFKANALLTLLNTQLFGTSTYSNYLEFLREITTPHLTALGYEAVDYEPSANTSLRLITKDWNCRGLHEACLTNEYEKLLQFYKTNANVSFDYCHALRNVNGDVYQALLAGVATNLNYASRADYLANLGCSLDGENLKNFLAIALNASNVLSANERQNIFFNTMNRSMVALETTIEFIDANYATLNTTVSSLSNLLQSLAVEIKSNENVYKLEGLIRKLLDNGIAMNASQIRRNYLVNIEWQNNNFQAINDWFSTSTAASRTSHPTQHAQSPSSATSAMLSFMSFIVAIAVIVRLVCKKKKLSR